MCVFSYAYGNAQVAIEESKVLDNTFIGVQGGIMSPLDMNSVTPFNVTAGLHIGKWVSPIVGLEIEGNAIFGDNHFTNTSTFVKAINTNLNGLVNISNLLFNYKGSPRFVEISTVTGLGWLHKYSSHDWNTNLDYLTAKTGARVMFNCKKGHSFYIEPAVNWSLSGHDHGVEFNKNYAQLGLQVGYTYNFKTSNGTHSFVLWNVGEMMNTINSLRAELEKKPTEVVVEKEVKVKVPVYVVKERMIFFAKNSYELTTEGKQVLNGIKENSNVKIIATASPEGEHEYNMILSQKRANVVKEYLESRGVQVLAADGLGAQSPTSNRVAVVTVE